MTVVKFGHLKHWGYLKTDKGYIDLKVTLEGNCKTLLCKNISREQKQVTKGKSITTTY